jgi:hypothetical protein
MNEETNERSGKMRRKWKQMKAKMQGRYATPFYVQLWELIKRSFLQYWRTPPDFMAKITSPLLMGLIMVRLCRVSRVVSCRVSCRVVCRVRRAAFLRVRGYRELCFCSWTMTKWAPRSGLRLSTSL